MEHKWHNLESKDKTWRIQVFSGCSKVKLIKHNRYGLIEAELPMTCEQFESLIKLLNDEQRDDRKARLETSRRESDSDDLFIQ